MKKLKFAKSKLVIEAEVVGGSRVARWFIFKPNPPVLGNFGRRLNGNFLCIFYNYLVYL
jgi:hypothetical protein